MTPIGTLERRRIAATELRATKKDMKNTIGGYAALFNVETEPFYGMVERIAPGAFAESLAADDARCFWNHDERLVLGRRSAETLRLSEDAKGLLFECDTPDTTTGRDAIVSIERRDVTGMSIGFIKIEDRWEDLGGLIRRTLLKATLVEVSPVTFPAYESTDVAVRSAKALVEEGRKWLASSHEGSIAIRRRKLDLALKT